MSGQVGGLIIHWYSKPPVWNKRSTIRVLQKVTKRSFTRDMSSKQANNIIVLVILWLTAYKITN